MIFASVEEGRLTLCNHDKTKRSFSLDDKGKAELAETMKEWGIDPDGDVMCSSSVDFPEEYGAPDMDVRGWIGDAMVIAAGPPDIYFKVGQLEEMAKALRDGNVEAVIERLERNIKMARGE